MPESDLERARRLLTQADRLEDRLYHLHASQTHHLVISRMSRIYLRTRERVTRRWRVWREVRRLERAAREAKS